MIAVLVAALVAHEAAVVGSLGKFRPPVSLNGRPVTRDGNKYLLHVGDIVHCGKGANVTMKIGTYVVVPPCPSDYPIPNVGNESDPGQTLKRGAIVGVYRIKTEPNCGSASASFLARGGGGDVAQAMHYTGVTCDCPEDILDGQFCIDNESHAKIWYVFAAPTESSAPPTMQLLPPDHEIAHGEVYQFEVPTSQGRCVYDVMVEFADGTSAHWQRGNFCGTEPLTREWEVRGPSMRTGNPQPQ